MFYLKKNGAEISFNESEVYTCCPICGKERTVDDFFELLADDPDFDVFSTSLYCEKCAEEWRKRNEGVTIPGVGGSFNYDEQYEIVSQNIDMVSMECMREIFRLVTEDIPFANLRGNGGPITNEN